MYADVVAMSVPSGNLRRPSEKGSLMADRISNYRQVRLIISPWEGQWSRAYWSTHFLTVKQGIPRSEVADDGLLLLGSETPTQEDFWGALASLCAARSHPRSQ